MTDLLDKFEQLLGEYQRLIEASAPASAAHEIMQFHHAIGDAARDALDFLIEHDATVTFATPPDAEPTEPTTDLRNFVRRNGSKGENWYPKSTSEECIRCGTWYEKGHLNQYYLCHGCEMSLAEDSDGGAADDEQHTTR